MIKLRWMINLFAKQVEKLQDRAPVNHSISQNTDLTTSPPPQLSEVDHRFETGGSDSEEEMPHQDRVKKIREVLGQVWPPSITIAILCVSFQMARHYHLLGWKSKIISLWKRLFSSGPSCNLSGPLF